MFKLLRFRHFIIPIVSVDLHLRLRDSRAMVLIESTRNARVQKQDKRNLPRLRYFNEGTVLNVGTVRNSTVCM